MNQMIKILVIEDEKNILNFIVICRSHKNLYSYSMVL